MAYHAKLSADRLHLLSINPKQCTSTSTKNKQYQQITGLIQRLTLLLLIIVTVSQKFLFEILIGSEPSKFPTTHYDNAFDYAGKAFSQ